MGRDGINNTWPGRMRLGLVMFGLSLRIASMVTPNRRLMRQRVSPGWTV